MDSSHLPMSGNSNATPEWVRDAVFYQIFPDRFACSNGVHKPNNLEPWGSPPTGHGFQGGDLLGVVEKLDYLQDLGITALYFCPIFRSAANHRYHTHDYYEVDPILGGNAALQTLLKEAHRRGMRVVLDGVFNHASRGFFQFSHILENGAASPYIDWFRIHSWPLNPYGPGDGPPGYACWWNIPALPQFNTDTSDVRDFLWNVGAHWIEQGIDGWRLDVPNEIDDDCFWREFRRRVKGVNPEAYIVGEIWGDARRWLAGDQFDAVMNYLFTRACIGFFAGRGAGIDNVEVAGTGLNYIEPCDASSFRSAIDAIIGLYPWNATLSQLNLLDSHDTARFLTIAREDRSSFELATLFQMTFPGAPCVYYGDEVALLGGRDPDCRRAFPWDQSRWNHDVRDHVRRCIDMRRQHTVLRRGYFTSLLAQGDVFAFARHLDDEIAIVVLNAGHKAETLDVPLPGVREVKNLRSIWGRVKPVCKGEILRGCTLPPRSGAVLVGRAFAG